MNSLNSFYSFKFSSAYYTIEKYINYNYNDHLQERFSNVFVKYFIRLIYSRRRCE